jgi:hypothetical protein
MGVYSLVGITDGQKIASIDVDNTTLTVTLKLADGSIITNNLTMTKADVMGKNGNATEFWQVAKIEIK